MRTGTIYMTSTMYKNEFKNKSIIKRSKVSNEEKDN